MKRLILAVMMLMVYGVCSAEVVGEIISTSLDENGNILVKTAYFLDGMNVQSNYPQEGGKYYWVTRYNFNTFYGMDNNQTIARVKQDLQQFGETLIQQKFIKEETAKLDMSKVIGQNVTIETSTIKVSDTKELVINTKGEYIEQDINSNNTIIPKPK